MAPVTPAGGGPRTPYMSSLVVTVDSASGTQRLEFRRSPVRIGRGVENDVRLPLPFVSERHAEVRFDELDASYLDFGSTNGSFVAGQRLTANVPSRFVAALTIEIGAVRITFERRPTLSEGAARPGMRTDTPAAPPIVSPADLVTRDSGARSRTPLGHPAMAPLPSLVPGAEPPEMDATIPGAPSDLEPFVPSPPPVRPPSDPNRLPTILPGDEASGARAVETRKQSGAGFGKIALPTIFPLSPEPGARAQDPSPPPPTAVRPAPSLDFPAPRGMDVRASAMRAAHGWATARVAPAALAAAGATVPARAAASAETEGNPGELRRLVTVLCEELVKLRAAYEELGREMGVRTFARSERSRLHELRDPGELARFITNPTRHEELRDLFTDMASHHLALLPAIVEGARATLAQVDPATFAEGGRKRLLEMLKGGARWEEYLAHFRAVLEDDEAIQAAVFGPEFAEAYAATRGK